MKELAQKLSLLYQIVFWTQNIGHPLNSTATKKFNNNFLLENYYFSWGLFYMFLLSYESFLNYCQKRAIAFAFYPPSGKILANSFHLGVRKWTWLRVFDDKSKTVDLRPKISKLDPNWKNFLMKNFFLRFFVAPKLSK